jgi:flagellar FliL protein
MSEIELPEPEVKSKKGKGLITKLVIALALISIGGGGTYALIQSGMIGAGGEDSRKKAPDHPRLILKGEEDPYAPKAAEGEKEGEGGAEIEGEGGSKYRTVYYSFAEDFTANLKNSEALVQVNLAASTRRDGRVLMWLKKHELAIRSEILVVLADTPEEDVTTPQGKERMQQRIAGAINKVLNQTEGFGGIDAVYFKSFLIQ